MPKQGPKHPVVRQNEREDASASFLLGFRPEGHMLRLFWSEEKLRGKFEDDVFREYSRNGSAERSSEQLLSRKFQEQTVPGMFLGNVPHVERLIRRSTV